MGALQGGQAWTEKVALRSMGFLFQVHHLVKQMMEDVTGLKLEWQMTTSPGLGSEQGSALTARPLLNAADPETCIRWPKLG